MDSNYYGLKHEVVAKQFSGDLTYVTTMCVDDSYRPWAIYHAASPDLSKGHKEYMLLQVTGTSGTVTGKTAEQLAHQWVQDALQCPACSDIIISFHRHDMHYCKCGECFIDGGRDYTRRTLFGTPGTYNHLTGEFHAAS